jgi:hypothetical protein
MIIFAAPIEQHPFIKSPVVVTMSNNVPAFPASNLMTYDPTQVAKAAADGTCVINVDCTVNRTFSIVSLMYANVGPRAGIKVQGSLDNVNWVTLQDKAFWANRTVLAGAGPFAEDADPRKGSLERNHSFLYTGTEWTYRYLRITVSDVDNPTLSFGRLFIGRAFRPKMSYQYGSGFKFEDSGTSERTDQGALVLNPGKSIVLASVKLDFISTDEMYDYIWEFNYWRGSCREFFCCLDVTNTPKSIARLQKNLLYCTIKDGRNIDSSTFEAWSQTWILESF